MTRTGLSSDVTIKVGKRVGAREGPDRPGTEVSGSVTGRISTKTSKDYHNTVPDLVPEGELQGPDYIRGAIRLRDSTVIGGLGALTLIHEATHKYAGTIDYRYYLERQRRWSGPLEEPAKAIINADSYAWFVQSVGTMQ